MISKAQRLGWRFAGKQHQDAIASHQIVHTVESILRGTLLPQATEHEVMAAFGADGDTPIIGDYSGDGTDLVSGPDL